MVYVSPVESSPHCEDIRIFQLSQQGLAHVIYKSLWTAQNDHQIILSFVMAKLPSRSHVGMRWTEME